MPSREGESLRYADVDHRLGISVRLKETGKGAVVAFFMHRQPRGQGGRPTNLQSSTERSGFTGWSTGGGADFDLSLTRRHSFGLRGQGTVEDKAGGTWHVSWNSRYQITRDDEFIVRSKKFNVHQIGK